LGGVVCSAPCKRVISKKSIVVDGGDEFLKSLSAVV
jgi:hypothetical protein